MEKTRIESDSIGSLEIPENVYYGVQTSRGCRNFNITGVKMNDRFIKNIVKIKKAAAIVNAGSETISHAVSEAIVAACDEALSGKFDGDFVTDAIQGGAGTTVNMNVNEVIANRATELLGGKKTEAYLDNAIRQRVYRDIYNQLRREFGIYDDDGKMKSYKALKRKDLADAHEFVDCYTLPAYLAEQINDCNAQMRMGGADGV